MKNKIEPKFGDLDSIEGQKHPNKLEESIENTSSAKANQNLPADYSQGLGEKNSRGIVGFLLKALSLVFWLLFISNFAKASMGAYALATNWEEAKEYGAQYGGYALGQIIGETLYSPLLFAIVFLIPAILLWRWSHGTKNDLSLFDKIRLAIGLR